MKKILSVLLMILVVGFCFADEIESEENTTTVDLSVLESQNQLLQLFSENQLNQDSLNAITAVNDALAKENEAQKAEIENLLYFSDVTEAVGTLGKEKCGFKPSATIEKASDIFLSNENFEPIEKYGIMAVLFKLI